MPHARKPKINSQGGPPGLSPPDSEGRGITKTVSFDELGAKVDALQEQVMSLYVLANDMKVSNILERIALLERVFVFMDVDSLNAAFKAAAAAQGSVRAEIDCMGDGAEEHDAVLTATLADAGVANHSRYCTFDPMGLLVGMASAATASPLHPEVEITLPHTIRVQDIAGAFEQTEGESLLCVRLRTREESDRRVRAAQEVWNAMVSIGIIGSIKELQERSLLVFGTILESTVYQNVLLDGFNGMRYITASPLVSVSGTYARGRSVIVLRDAAANPTEDNRGETVFGESGRVSESFCIVGNMRFGGQMTTNENLSADNT